jgi:hypothetical protein
MQLIQRVQDILLKPNDTWPVIAGEPGDIASIYKDYLIYLALIPAVCGFIGMSLIGFGGFGFSMRIPIVSGLVSMLVGYVMSLVMVFVISLVANALAPKFGGTPNPLNALKLIAYGSTAGMVGGIFSLLPSLSMLGLLTALYSVYLIYTGVPVLMKCPAEKSMPYTAVLIVCGVVAGIILGALSAAFSGGHQGMMTGQSSGNPAFSINTPKGSINIDATKSGNPSGNGAISINTPEGSINIDAAKMEEMAKKMAEIGQKMEQAQAAAAAANKTPDAGK